MKSRSRYSAPISTPFPARPEQPRPRRLPKLRLTRPSDSTIRLLLRTLAGIAFVTLGQMKFFDSILLGTDAVSLPQGPEGFAQYLAAIGIPFPLLNAYMVCFVEMLCGVGLLLSAFMPRPALATRLTAFPLFMDMVVALVTVGVPNLLGHPVMLDGVAVTNQAWRFPLEGALLAITLMLLVRPMARREPEVVPVMAT
jgi:putative oxidoreductase